MGSHLAGDYLATLANSKSTKSLKSSPNVLLTFSKFPNVIHARKRSPEVVEIFKIYATIRRPWYLTPNPQTVAVFPKYSRSCGKLFDGLAKCTSTARHCSPSCLQKLNSWGIFGENNRTFCERLVTVWRRFGEDFAKYSRNIPHLRHLFTKQLPNNHEFADFLPRSPISHQMFAKRSENNHLFIAEWSQNSLIIRRFSPFFVTKLSLIVVNCSHLAVTPNLFNTPFSITTRHTENNAELF